MEILDSVGMNLNTKKLLFDDGKFEKEEDYGSGKNLYIIKVLELYSEKRNKLVKLSPEEMEIFQCFRKHKKNHELIINLDKSINFELISENLQGISKLMKSELHSQKRVGKCHKRSIDICTSLEGSKVLTGIIKLESRHVLHSVVEVIGSESKKTKIIDWTRNIILEKQDYIDLFEFKEITSIDSDTLISDRDIVLNMLLDELSTKAYLLFRDEIMKDLYNHQYLLTK